MLAQKRQKFMVSRCALDRRLNCSHCIEAKHVGRVEDSFNCLLPDDRVAYNAALAHFGFSDLKLRLNQDNYVGDRRDHFNNRR